MKRFYVLCILFSVVLFPLFAQSNKLIKELEQKRGDLQKQIAETESLLNITRKDVGSQLNGLAALTGQIEERKRYIVAMNQDVEAIDRELSALQRQLNRLQRDLKEKKNKYEASVQYLYKNRSIEEKLMFIFSAENLAQTYRRLRYVREYATYQRLQGQEIQKKQKQVEDKKKELTQVKAAKENLLKEREQEKSKLEQEEKQQRALVDSLKKKQKGLQNAIAKKRREANELNTRIDRLIAQEIEKARRRAQEEAKREAAARKKQQKVQTATATHSSKVAPLESFSMNKADRELSGSFAGNKGRLPMPITGPYMITSHYGQYAVAGIAQEIEKARRRAQEEAKREAAARKKQQKVQTATATHSSKVAPLESFSMNKADRELSGSFAGNKGRLPMPITGPYMITSHYGQYAVAGLRNVKLDNKGIDIQGKPGAQARAVFDGKVAAVFKLNGLFNVLVRHGAYISVYCNLSVASVKSGDMVKTRQPLGTMVAAVFKLNGLFNVLVRHGAYISVYCNLSVASVKSGDMVKTRQPLGTIFSDGTDNGRTVLHFQLRKEKEKLNPEPWLDR